MTIAVKILQLCLYGINGLETLTEGDNVIKNHLPKLKQGIQHWISQETMIGGDSFGCEMQKAPAEKGVMFL